MAATQHRTRRRNQVDLDMLMTFEVYLFVTALFVCCIPPRPVEVREAARPNLHRLTREQRHISSRRSKQMSQENETARLRRRLNEPIHLPMSKSFGG
ncbi:uncharacterized protein CC84DRAFT_431768 [Paraphaeosphaeria sporulosa]|uniref:Uncharacterized protein n=1 Tax=Paraphaeosphaeria sporulosa TaxID=1460663 RepID=A0A177CPI6_9PLEO|nr:uncharacterized protein CC84DRAFT_431768 [Paraphaeosphaeria sporulosa]OAG09216.1 hypothetical protein CC84DRAFT_431768 [Paraphaeosphaeria sporulosa]